MQAGKNVMASTKEKVSNMASSAKEHIDIYKAKVEEKAEKASARNKEEKEIAHERKQAKVAEAKMNLHAAKAENKAEKENAKHSHGLGTHGVGAGMPAHHTSGSHEPAAGMNVPVGMAVPTTAGTAVPTYPPAGNPAAGKYL